MSTGERARKRKTGSQGSFQGTSRNTWFVLQGTAGLWREKIPLLLLRSLRRVNRTRLKPVHLKSYPCAKQLCDRVRKKSRIRRQLGIGESSTESLPGRGTAHWVLDSIPYLAGRQLHPGGCARAVRVPGKARPREKGARPPTPAARRPLGGPAPPPTWKGSGSAPGGHALTGTFSKPRATSSRSGRALGPSSVPAIPHGHLSTAFADISRHLDAHGA